MIGTLFGGRHRGGTPPAFGSPSLIIDGVTVSAAFPIFFDVGTKVFTASRSCSFTLIGTPGGGGGGGGTQYLNDGQAGGGGGGGGAAVNGMVLTCVAGPTYTVTVGRGGFGATAPGTTGEAGWPTTLVDSSLGTRLSLGGGGGGGYGARLGGVAGYGLGGAGGVVITGTGAVGGAGGDASGTEYCPDVGTVGASGALLPNGTSAPGGGGGGGKADRSTAGLNGGTAVGSGAAGGIGGTPGNNDPGGGSVVSVGPTMGQGGLLYWGDAGSVNPSAFSGASGGGGGGMLIPGYGWHGGGGSGGGGPAGAYAGLTPYTLGGNGMAGGLLLVYIVGT